MVATPTRGVHSTATDGPAALTAPWRRSLAARRASPRTIATYMTAVDQLAVHLAAAGLPTRVDNVRREHAEASISVIDNIDGGTQSPAPRALAPVRW